MPTSWLDLLRWTLSPPDWPLCSGVHCRPPLSVPRRQLLSSSSFFQPTLFSRPLPLPDPPRFQAQNTLSGFAPKQTKESSAWRPTYIVLQNFLLGGWCLANIRTILPLTSSKILSFPSVNFPCSSSYSLCKCIWLVYHFINHLPKDGSNWD